MIDNTIVENIRTHGTCFGRGDEKRNSLDEIGFPVGRNAEYVIIAGCFQPLRMPHVLKAFKNILDNYSVRYTLLEKEYCCAWGLIGRTAVLSKNEEDVARSKELSQEFIQENFRQAKLLGAKSIVLFCGACEPAYTNYRDLTDLEIISQYELIDRYFKGGRLDAEIDFYAGCYRFRRPITDRPVDVAPAMRLLNKIEGLNVNHLNDKLCCYIPPLMDKLTDSIKTGEVVNICTGCYHNLKEKLKGNESIRVSMLAETVWQAICNL